jgi:hypothetical protein
MTSAASSNTSAEWGKLLDDGTRVLICPDCIQAERQVNRDVIVESVDLRSLLDGFMHREPIYCDRCGVAYALPLV